MRIVRVVVPVAAGGGVDVMARLLAQKLSERLRTAVRGREPPRRRRRDRQQGGDRLRRADGYTLLYTPSSLSLVGRRQQDAALRRRARTSPRSSTSRSARMRWWCILRCRPIRSPSSSPTPRPIPAKLSYSSAGVGSASHLAAEMLKSMAGIEMVHVPNKGMNPALVDLIGGQVQVLFAQRAGVMTEKTGPRRARSRWRRSSARR